MSVSGLVSVVFVYKSFFFKYDNTAFEWKLCRTANCDRTRLRLRRMRILMAFRYGRRRRKTDALELQKEGD